jgi:alpha-1,2-rhamnosyltransferase
MKNGTCRHFYVDCTKTYFDFSSSGISRVVRMLVELADVPRELGCGEVHPVVFCRDRYYILPTCAIFADNPFTRDKFARGVRKYTDFARYRRKLISVFSISRAWARQVADRQARLEKIFPGALRPLEEAELSPHDFLVLPELVDHATFPGLFELKKKLKLAVVMHDLIPFTHPDYCNAVRPIIEFCKFAAINADVIVSVSRFTEACFQAYEKLLTQGGIVVGEKRYAWFHPGCDLDGDSAPPSPSREMAGIFSDGVPVYLVCGTIEPRKNHLLVLKVFGQLWAEGHAIKLLFVGRYGWKAGETRREILRHPELGRRLFWLSQSSDADLRHAYRHCHAVIFPSRVEGFGIPLVEALAMGRQVIFSRISSFEEIVPADFLVNSFTPDQPEELLHLVRETLRANDRLNLQHFTPTTWRESVRQFYRGLAAPDENS